MASYFDDHSVEESHQNSSSSNEQMNMEQFIGLLNHGGFAHTGDEEMSYEQIQELLDRFNLTNKVPPVSKRFLRDLEVIHITTRKILQEEKLQDENCTICCDNFEVGNNVHRLPSCGHCFHQKCLQTWLLKQASCPLCRKEFETDEPAYEVKKLDSKDKNRKKEFLQSIYM